MFSLTGSNGLTATGHHKNEGIEDDRITWLLMWPLWSKTCFHYDLNKAFSARNDWQGQRDGAHWLSASPAVWMPLSLLGKKIQIFLQFCMFLICKHQNLFDMARMEDVNKALVKYSVVSGGRERCLVRLYLESRGRYLFLWANYTLPGSYFMNVWQASRGEGRGVWLSRLQHYINLSVEIQLASVVWLFVHLMLICCVTCSLWAVTSCTASCYCPSVHRSTLCPVLCGQWWRHVHKYWGRFICWSDVIFGVSFLGGDCLLFTLQTWWVAGPVVASLRVCFKHSLEPHAKHSTWLQNSTWLPRFGFSRPQYLLWPLPIWANIWQWGYWPLPNPSKQSSQFLSNNCFKLAACRKLPNICQLVIYRVFSICPQSIWHLFPLLVWECGTIWKSFCFCFTAHS